MCAVKDRTNLSFSLNCCVKQRSEGKNQKWGAFNFWRLSSTRRVKPERGCYLSRLLLLPPLLLLRLHQPLFGAQQLLIQNVGLVLCLIARGDKHAFSFHLITNLHLQHEANFTQPSQTRLAETEQKEERLTWGQLNADLTSLEHLNWSHFISCTNYI